MDGKDHFVFYQKLHASDWVLIAQVPKSELFSEISDLRRNLLLGSIAWFIATIVVSYALSSNIARPLAKLAKAIGFIERGEFNIAKRQIPVLKSYNSEIGSVIKVFGYMTDRLKHLIETEFEANLRRKNAEYKALLLQINPHFMNNTLELIGALAAQGKNREVMDVSVSLARMMKYSLDTHSDLVKLSEEIAYIHHFADILKLRYEDQIHIKIDEDPETKQMTTIKFILQPLVENAVKYSYENKKFADISIMTRKTPDGYMIQVEDKGSGMSPEFVSRLMSEESKKEGIEVLESAGRSIGFRNVIARMKLYYNDRFQWEIVSVKNEGTKIVFSIKTLE